MFYPVSLQVYSFGREPESLLREVKVEDKKTVQTINLKEDKNRRPAD